LSFDGDQYASDEGLDLTTKGQIHTHDSSANAALNVGSNTYLLTADSTETTGMKWAAAAAGATLTQQTVNPTHASTYSGTSYANLTGTTNITLPTRSGGIAFLQYDVCGEKNTTGYIVFGFYKAGVGIMNQSIIGVGLANIGIGGSISAMNVLDGSDYQMQIKQDGGTTTVYSAAVSGTTQMLSFEVS